MDYMVTLYSDENFEMPSPGTPEFEGFMGEWMAYNQRLIDGGHWISAASLQPTVTATTITKTFGAAPKLTDGPYAETKEQLGGFYLISAANLDEALALAADVPIPVGSFEVRPVAFRPDAPNEG
jgi:hypothetical protein